MTVLTPEQLDEIRPYLEETRFSQGDVLLWQGRPGSHFHIIEHGQVDVMVAGETRVRVATLGPGEFIGEMSCLAGDPISANVEAMGEVVTLSVDREGLLRLIDVSQVMRHFLFGALIRRVKNTNQRVQEENLRTSVMAETIKKEGEERYPELLGKSPLMEAVREQVRHLAHLQVAVAVLGEPGTGRRHAAARLHYEGPRSPYPLLFVEGRSFDWKDWLRQHDAAEGGTIILMHADQLPADDLQRIIHSSGRVRVVLTARSLPMEQEMTTLTLPTLQERREDVAVMARHFLRRTGSGNPDQGISGEALRQLMIFPFLEGNVKELERVIREAHVLSGDSPIRPEHLRLGAYRAPGSRPRVGLALGAGAVRGGAHLGVIKVLEQEGIPIDVVAGTSAGAMAGAMYSAGLPIDKISQILCSTRWRDMIKFRWSNEAIFDSTPMEKTFERLLNNITFEELKLPFAAVAADAATGQPVVFRSGPVAPAVRASAAIPMLMRPVRHHGKILVDGGVVHKVPAIVCRSMGADMVIAVNVSAPAYSSGPPRNLFEALMNAFDITSERLTYEELEWADVVIHPDLRNLGQKLSNTPSFIAKGEDACRAAMPDIRRRFAALAERM